ncbi:MAG: DUF3299 domain-containing protein [Nitrospiraceae bacterium]|nr:DUF3299 domain-containing protein [Nitrospiraceae bacterium]
MRTRAKRDLITLLGVVLILAGVVGVNTYMRLDSLKEQYEKLRIQFEDKQKGKGHTLLEWGLLKETKGKFRSGPTFSEDLESLHGELVNICGFMSPIDQFRKVTEFMLLPVPLTCYFCDSPPMREIIEIRLAKPADIVNEPVLIGGTLKLNKKGDLFFYTIDNAKWNEAVDMKQVKSLTKQKTDEEHRAHLREGFRQLREGQKEEVLMDGQEPPKLETPVVDASIANDSVESDATAEEEAAPAS